ncbi:MAG: tetratricopeptide repeat protein [Candidatus Aminicenantales bacterium]
MKKSLLVLSTAFLFSACGPSGKIAVQTAVPTPEDEAAIHKATDFAARGSYVALKEACRIYAERYAKPSLRGRIAADYFRAIFLLSLRGRELGIGDDATLPLTERLIAENPDLAGYRAWPDAAKVIPLRINGIVRDSIPWLERTVSEEEVNRLLADLLARAPGDVLAAYFYLALACPDKSPHDKVDDRAAIRAAHPRSVLINYRTAFCPELVAERFDEVLKTDPEFWEAYGFRAETALGRGELLSAEKDLLIASEHISDSAYFPSLLARIYFITEEFEESILFCDKALVLFPEYRDAYLTKAICLSQLGRYEEAIDVLTRIIEMRYYLQGEAFYWLAWNHHALKDLEAARGFIESAKGPLPTNSQVFGLAGTIDLESNDPDGAEADFREALIYDAANDEALMGLARIAERRGKWPEAAGFYEKTAAVMDGSEETLKAKIEEINSSSLSESRRTKMLAKKESQLRLSETIEGASLYNAAVAWANAGQTAAAAAAAERAAAIPQFKERAAELLKKIK